MKIGDVTIANFRYNAPLFFQYLALFMQHNYQDLIALFQQVFFEQYNTRLIKGQDEPLYSPADENCAYHQIIFAHGYYASAFHEIAHWCQAGEKRRLLEDFGYWYIPDGRNEKQQKKFEQVEVYPQALEWAFNVAAQKKFHTSADNLNGYQGDTEGFKAKVYQQVLVFIEYGFPPRAQKFIEALALFYKTTLPLAADQFAYVAQSSIESCVESGIGQNKKEQTYETF